MSIRLRGLCMAGLVPFFMVAAVAHADLRVGFDEGAPKDRFWIKNTGACTVSETSLLVDLSPSRGGLIFDVTSRGKGVEVFQPFELVEGAEALKSVPTVVDGQKEIRLEIVSLAPNETIAFTIDVDDTRGNRAITVSGNEIEGAIVRYSNAQVQSSATFSANSEAELPISTC